MPAVTVSRFCSSSLQALRMAFHAIEAGEGDQYVAAGVEAVSRFPAHPPFDPHPQLDGSDGAPLRRLHPDGAHRRERRQALRRLARGPGRVGGDLAAARRRAQESGHFAARSCPVELPTARRSTRDDGPRPGTTVEVLAQLKPAFDPEGTVTAGNACPLNDGAAAVLVMSAERARGAGGDAARADRRVLGGRDPAGDHGPRPDPGGEKVLAQAGMTIADIDVLELNEAFAAQVVPCRDEWGIDPDKLNPFGGAIALGHPFGMTGARIMTTLLNDLDALDGTIGLETMCVAGGMGQAMIVERLS